MIWAIFGVGARRDAPLPENGEDRLSFVFVEVYAGPCAVPLQRCTDKRCNVAPDCVIP